MYGHILACNSESIGVADVVSHVVSQAAACPQQVFALVGYSQGADLMHNATIQLNTYPNIGPKGQFQRWSNGFPSLRACRKEWLN
jgi:hypothetical protein